MGELRKRLVAAIPPLAWRDELLAGREKQVRELRRRVADRDRQIDTHREEIARHRAELATYRGDLRSDLLPPSFRRTLMATRRTAPAIWGMDGARQHPFIQVPYKLRNYRLAASHGVPVPSVLGVWRRPGTIDLDGLPERFVLKSDRGAGSSGVLPLQRLGPDRYRLVGDGRELEASSIRAYLESTPTARGPYFAEEMLEQPDLGPDLLPDDVKVYAFHGRVGHVLLRRPTEHGNLATMAYRFVDDRGVDLGDDLTAQRIDPGIPLPANFARIIELAEHLSRAVALPFIRVDLYDTTAGPVLGELTRTPGGPQLYRADHDRWLGELWTEARLRLDVEIQAGRPPFTLHGSLDVPNPYPAGHASWKADAGHWTVHQAPCERWCLPDDAGLGHVGRESATPEEE